ncbi:unnamed protein product, partial (mitochondrion) [Musa banksii]
SLNGSIGRHAAQLLGSSARASRFESEWWHILLILENQSYLLSLRETKDPFMHVFSILDFH